MTLRQHSLATQLMMSSCLVFLHIHYALVATCTCVWALLMDYRRVLCVDIHTVLDMYMCTSFQELHWTQFVISLHKYLCGRLT